MQARPVESEPQYPNFQVDGRQRQSLSAVKPPSPLEFPNDLSAHRFHLGRATLQHRQICVRSVVARWMATGTRRLEDRGRQVFNSEMRWIELPMDRSEPPGLISAMRR